MQIDQIRGTDILLKEKSKPEQSAFSEINPNNKSAEGSLRTIQMDAPTYNKNTLKEQTVLDKLEKDMERGTDANTLMNQLAVYANTTSVDDLQKMQEEGFDPKNTKVESIVTVVDRIKMALAKGGMDISSMGGLSSDKIEAMTGDAAMSKAVETAMLKARELSGELSEDSVKYLLSNDLEPSIENMYQANYGAGSADYGNVSTEDFAANVQVNLDMQDAFAEVISGAGYEVTEEHLKDCQWMMDNQIPVTEESFIYLQELKGVSLDRTEPEIEEMIGDALAEGKRPEEGMYLVKYSSMAQAREAYEKQEKALPNITDARQREEARMILSVQANYALIKIGFAIDTMSIQEVVEELKTLEQESLGTLLSADSVEETQKNVDNYVEFESSIGQLKQLPEVLLSTVDHVMDKTVPELLEAGSSIESTYRKAVDSYETLWTAPRKDMGDSIQKAFANIDAILEDLGLDVTEANRRAVRILSYNEKELTVDNINNIKLVDIQVQKTFNQLKPGVVMEMIRQGKNPLDLSMKELSDTAQEIAATTGESQEEKFSKFLWEAERMGDVTVEERDSFIGVYRLIYQVEAGDGAAIGALLAQGAEVTLRNLMTAVRSSKHSGRDYTIDDSFGALEDFEPSSLSITEQVEMAFQKECLSQAGEIMTPVKMKSFDGEESYMDMTPEEFRDELVQMNESEIREVEANLDKEYTKEVQQEVRRALQSEQQVLEILERNDLPKTPAFLTGITEMLKDRNSVYRNLLKYGEDKDIDDITIEDVISDLIEDFGEAVKTPKEMADAQRKLEETAENVMKKMLVERDVRSIDVRGMKMVMTQIQALGQIAEESETYTIPIMVEDKLGNLSLKIVRGSNEKGLVEVAMDMEDTGVVHGSFRYEAGEVQGDLSFEKREVQMIFADHMHLLAEAMSEETELPVSFKFAWDNKTDISDFYQEKDPGFEVTKEQSEVSTKVLYGIARSFIDTMNEII